MPFQSEGLYAGFKVFLIQLIYYLEKLELTDNQLNLISGK